MRRCWLVLLGFASTLLAATVRADDVSDTVAAGRRSYTSLCARCHGLDLVTAGYGLDLRTFPKDGKERFLRSVNKGLRAMPAWEGAATPEQIEAIWVYIGAVNGWADRAAAK
jgi:mono/diheme cytochrome c family protein